MTANPNPVLLNHAADFQAIANGVVTLVGAGILKDDEAYRLLVDAGIIDDVRGKPEEPTLSQASPRRWLFGGASIGVGAALAMFQTAVLFNMDASVAILGKPSTVADALGLTAKLFGAKYRQPSAWIVESPNGVRVKVFRPDQAESIRGYEFSFLLVLDWPESEEDWWTIESAVRRGATIVSAKLPPSDYVQAIVLKPDTFAAIES